jgi:flagellar hook-associated protein 1 FlgK
MAGLFNTFNTAVKGLNAQQTALHTTSHNISNANTEGFSRQRVDMKADAAYNYAGVGQLGTGVKLEGVFRMVDEFVDYQIRNESSTLNKYMSKNDVMSQIEMVFNEPSDTGLNFAMSEMFNAWQELSKNPESLNAQSIVAEKSKSFADTLNHMAMQISDLRVDTQANIDKEVLDISSLTDQLNTVNEQIFNITVKGHSPNDLLDQRDLLLKKLSGIADISQTYDKWGRASVTLGGQVITGKDTPITTDDFNINLITSGKIGGYRQAMAEIDQRLAELDGFAQEMDELVNSVHKSGADGIEFFTFTDSTERTALNFRVNPVILNDESLVATGADNSSAPGDGSRALAIANLKNAKLMGGGTIEGKYRDIVIKVGISTEHAANMVSNQEALMAQLSNRRESVSGVSIDEEVTNLIKFQRSFEANSKVISILSEMLDTLINKTGV